MTVTPAWPDTGRLSRRSVVAGLIAAGISGFGGARAQPSDAPPDLRRGLNLSHWFAQSDRGYGSEHLATFVSDDDLAAMAHAGFSHVRLPVEPKLLFGEDGSTVLDPPLFESLVAVVRRIRLQGMGLVLDLHPVGSDKNGLTTERGAADFVARWRALATALVGAGLADLTLEILNEPEPNKNEAWWSLQGKSIEAVRSAGVTAWIVVSGGGWSGVDDLIVRQPYPDRKLIYTVHRYTPLLFTHQGATWTWDVARDIAGVSWPLTPAAALSASASVENGRSREFLRSSIAGGEFGVQALESQFDRLAKWSDQYGKLPIYIGEFGVYAEVAPVDARLRWIESVRSRIEAHGWGWALWDATSSFGLQAAGKAAFSPDTAMLHALGLRAK